MVNNCGAYVVSVEIPVAFVKWDAVLGVPSFKCLRSDRDSGHPQNNGARGDLLLENGLICL